MGDYASKGVAGSGLGLGIAGTALGLLNGNGFNLFGNNNRTAELEAKIAELNAEKYANQVSKEVYIASREQDNKYSNRFEELAREISDMRVREAQTQGKIDLVASNCNTGISTLNSNIQCLANTVAGITKTIVPITSVCPEPMKLYNSWTAPTNTPTTGS